MKIIGETTDGRIIEASNDELANLLGYHGEHRIDPQRSLRIGTEIKVHEMYRQLYSLAQAQRELKTASQTLHSIANLMLVADPLIQAVVAPGEGEAQA